MRFSRFVRAALAAAMVGSLLAAATPARADEEVSGGKYTGLQLGALGCTMFYGPAKLVYAGLGSIVSGFSWALTGGNTEVAKSIFVASAYGDYIITPEHLKGERPIEFVGREDRSPVVQDDRSVAGAPPAEDGF
jgi:hypothetical protein